MAKGICIITLSNNYDHQEVAFSMFNELYPQYNVFSIGLTNSKYQFHPITENSFYYDAPRRPGITKKSFNFVLIKKIVKKINSLPIDCVYFESEHLWNAFIMASLRKDIKKIVVIHDVIPHKDSKGKKLANKVCTKMADYVVIRNNKYKETLLSDYKVKPNKVLFLPLWRLYPEFKLNRDASYFLLFGRIRLYKGIESVLDIIKECPNSRFVIAGSSDRESKPIVEKIKQEKNVLVIDKEVSDDEMKDLFYGSKAVILPYSSATQSGVTIDAYKYGRPVIAFDVGAISEQIDNGVSGYLVKEKQEFIKAIKLVDGLTPEEIIKFQENSYKYGYDKYSVQKNSSIFIKTFLVD